MSVNSIATAKNSQCLRWIGILVDVSSDLGRDDGVAKALSWAEELEARKITARERALLEYYRANAWGCRQQARYRGQGSVWEWEQPEAERQVYCLRRAIQLPGFQQLPAARRGQILTNLGNQLSNIGRIVEAIATWTRALAEAPDFGMALGNGAHGLMSYSRALYDPDHKIVVMHLAHQQFTAALSKKAKYSPADKHYARPFFVKKKAEIEAHLNIDRISRRIDLAGHSMGTTKDEQRYRSWVLRERLFLNPLNDLGPHPIAAQDVLSLPSFIAPLKEPPVLIGFFNQLKQEYVSARWLLFDGLHGKAPHFSDRNVKLLNTLDLPSYSLAIEKMKAAYRIVYSILDKVAFFLNEYFKLGVAPHDVYFRTIWYQNGQAKKGLKQVLVQTENWPLRGLYWLSKDLFSPEFKDVMEPQAAALYEIRNSP